MAHIHADRHAEKQECVLQILFNVLLKKVFRPILLKRNKKPQPQNYVFFHSSFNKAVLSAEFRLRWNTCVRIVIDIQWVQMVKSNSWGMIIVAYTLGRMLRCSVASILRVWSTSHNIARLC
jgi:hypothetical protein